MKIALVFSLLSILFTFSNSEFTFLESVGDLKINIVGKGEVNFILDCESNLPTKHLRAIAKPEVVEKGKPINLKAQIQALSKIHIDDVLVIGKFNGVESFKDVKKLNDDVAEDDKYMYTYDTNVPEFIPAGTFEIFIYLRLGDKHLSCLKAYFSF